MIFLVDDFSGFEFVYNFIMVIIYIYVCVCFSRCVFCFLVVFDGTFLVVFCEAFGELALITMKLHETEFLKDVIFYS